jgi:nucleotide-binding universal stress UspA family protein
MTKQTAFTVWRSIPRHTMFQRLLLAIDGSDAGPVAISFTIALAPPGTVVHVVHVNQYQVGGRGLTVETGDEACRPVHDAVTDLLAAGVQATGFVCTSACLGVADRIVAEADRWAADAIVVGSRRFRGGRRLLGQGVRARVIRLSQLPVFIAPAPLKLSRRPGRDRRPARARSRRSAISP